MPRSREDFEKLRPVKIIPDFLPNPLSSVLIEFGNTKVLITVSLDDKVPPFLKGTGTGWITVEYAFLPGATKTRTPLEVLQRKGRSLEIQRMLGRVLRSVVDLILLGERTLWVDCDVLNADGGTRSASATGAFVALKMGFKKLMEQGLIDRDPTLEYLAGVSVGKLGNDFLLDLNYEEDSIVDVDANFFMTAFKGITELIQKQKGVLGEA